MKMKNSGSLMYEMQSKFADLELFSFKSITMKPNDEHLFILRHTSKMHHCVRPLTVG